MYIGNLLSFLDRVLSLKKATSPEYQGTSHIFARRYKAHPEIKNIYPYQNLYVEMTRSDSPENLEKEVLNQYFLKHCELPPLHRQG